MSEWTDAERHTIATVWGKIDVADIGRQALASVLIVYPWTRRYFGSFGDLSSAAAIMGNPKVAAHGKVVVGALEKGVKNLDKIRSTYSDLSTLHSTKLNVDPDNFRLLADCLTIVLGKKLGAAFTPEVQAALQKFLSAVVFALGKQYH